MSSSDPRHFTATQGYPGHHASLLPHRMSGFSISQEAVSPSLRESGVRSSPAATPAYAYSPPPPGQAGRRMPGHVRQMRAEGRWTRLWASGPPARPTLIDYVTGDPADCSGGGGREGDQLLRGRAGPLLRGRGESRLTAQRNMKRAGYLAIVNPSKTTYKIREKKKNNKQKDERLDRRKNTGAQLQKNVEKRRT